MTRWIICPECRGEGSLVHPALSVWTGEDIAEDPDAFDAMRSGAYDRTCELCGGDGKIRKRNDPRARRFAERLEDARLLGMESGDPELYYNPRLGLY